MSSEVTENKWNAKNEITNDQVRGTGSNCAKQNDIVSIAGVEGCNSEEAKRVESIARCSPATAALPPLPDLIPIRKSNLSLPNITGPSQKAASTEEEEGNVTIWETTTEIPSSHIEGVAEEPLIEHSLNETAGADASNESDSGILKDLDDSVESPPTAIETAESPEDNQTEASNVEIAKAPKQPELQDLQHTPMVQHRKSDRRRVERDIFFLFEEHPANRRRKTQRKRSPQKRGRPRTKPHPPPKLKIPRPRAKIAEAMDSSSPPITGSSGISGGSGSSETSTTPTTPRVNPIFLWVKQDDTRIVEVRCEDYDKRNRIRLTKTATGWRAIPRTDPTSSRVAKLPKPNPLIRVKQELRPDLLQTTTTTATSTESEAPDANYDGREKKNKKKKKKKKKKRKREHDKERQEVGMVSPVESTAEIPKILSPAPTDIVIYESTNHERNETEESAAEVQLPTSVSDLPEPNNNKATVDHTKAMLGVSVRLDMPQFMEQIQSSDAEPVMTLCPETGQFIPLNPSTEVPPTVDLTSGDLNESFDMDTKHLKELLDNDDLLIHCDNGMSGVELIDSLVKRGCEDNHISEDEHHQVKETICLSDDFENEEEDVLMRPEPVEDIISRLGESLNPSPKCLSFNEAGEIEGLHGELFQNTSNQSDPFNRNPLEELSITIKDLEAIPPKTVVSEPATTEAAESTTTIVSPDSCVDELPKDLTCKKTGVELTKVKEAQPQVITQPPQRTNSRSSDAIQSPQPSGLPAVPPSPDIVHSNKTKNVFIEQLLNQNSNSPKICSSITMTPIRTPAKAAQQKEPLDLGKHRKSASPTVSCSEEAKRGTDSDEPLHKRIKTEPSPLANTKRGSVSNLADMFTTGKDPNPLTQLRLLISNPEWKVPDPILVPKDRLSAVLASPAREIPLLLTTRPELRLPEAFAYPAILQDPDILVISMAQLEAILQKQVEITKPKTPTPQVTIEPVTRPIRTEKQVEARERVESRPKSILSPLTPLMTPGLANEIDAATLAAFNQMFWLPYLSQMAPELFKAMAGLPNSANLAEMLPFLAQQQQQQHQHQQKFQQQQQRQLYNAAAAAQFSPNSMAFQNPIELAMWQEALSQAQMQQALKFQREQQQHNKSKPTTPTETKPNIRQQQHNANMAALLAQKQQQQQQQQLQKSRTNFGLNPFRSDYSRPPNINRQNSQNGRQSSDSSHFVSPTSKNAKQHHTGATGAGLHQSHQSQVQNGGIADQKPRVTLKSLSNLLEPDRLLSQTDPKMSANLMAMPGFDFQHHQQQQQLHQQFGQFGNTAGSVGQNQQQQQQQPQSQQPSSQTQLQGKLKVKPGAHLLDPAAMQRRLLNYEEVPEVGSTTSGIDEMMNDPNSSLWHPLFGNNQKTGYTSPWQWTTVTATGE